MRNPKRKTRSKSRRLSIEPSPSNQCRNAYKLGIPMKDRKLPASFWQQPQRPNGNIRLHIGRQQQDVLFETRTMLIRIPTPPDTNLLFSLFKILDQSALGSHHPTPQTVAEGAHRTRSNPALVGRRSASPARPPDNNNHKHCDVANGVQCVGMRPQDDERTDDEDYVGEEPNGHQHRPHRISDDDPYLCVGSKDSRVGLDDKKSLLRSGDNFSDLLSDLVVNL